MKTVFLYKTIQTVQTSNEIFYKKPSIRVLSKQMNGLPRHLIAIPSTTFVFMTLSGRKNI